MLAAGVEGQNIAAKYHVHPVQISRIKNGTAWKHVRFSRGDEAKVACRSHKPVTPGAVPGPAIDPKGRAGGRRCLSPPGGYLRARREPRSRGSYISGRLMDWTDGGIACGRPPGSRAANDGDRDVLAKSE
jgi:hypothetical protein